MDRPGNRGHRAQSAVRTVAKSFMRGRRPARPGRGFTLVELLVSIAIIAVLAAFLMLAVTKMKAKAKSVTCVSNLRQLGTELQGIVSEIGYYPPSVSHSTNDEGGLRNNGDSWNVLLRENPNVGCPAAKFTGTHPRFPKRQISGYSANPTVCDDVKDNNPPYVRPTNILRPADIILLADGAQFNDRNNPRSIAMCAAWWLSLAGREENADQPLTTRLVPDGGFWDPDVSLIPMRHDGRANILFIDGHVTSIADIGELKEKNLYWNY